MGMEYRNRSRRQTNKRRREREEAKRWAELAGPVSVRRIGDGGEIAEEDRGLRAAPDPDVGTEAQGEDRDEPGATR